MADLELNSIGNGDGNNYLVRDNTKIPLTGTNALAGSIVPSTDNAYDLGNSNNKFKSIKTNLLSTFQVAPNTDSESLLLNHDLSYGGFLGSGLVLRGKNSSIEAGCFNLSANNGTNSATLQGTPSGTLSWGNKNVAMQEDVIPRSGGAVITGSTLGRTVDDNTLNVYGGKGYGHGAFLQLTGKDDAGNGEFNIQAHNGSTNVVFKGKADGTLAWGNKNVAMREDVVPRSGGAVMSGNSIGKTTNNDEFRIDGGTDFGQGGSLVVYGKDSPGHGQFRLYAQNGTVNHVFTGYPDGTLTWDGQPIQYTSDQRLKQQITQIDDDLLDAWEDVNPVQFKYNDAVKEKSDNARLHTGYVVQQIDEACKSHNVDISKYGLYCHEEYAEETREVEHDDGTKTTEVVRPASEHYSLRYTEALIVECAYLRRENARLKERLSKIEKLLNI